MDFVPLHVYSNYSFLKSGLKVDEYVLNAKKMGYKTLSLTDLSVFSGLPLFFDICHKYDIKPIAGLDLSIEGKTFTFIILNEIGYSNLLKLSNKLKNGEITLDNFKKYTSGLVVILDIHEVKEEFEKDGKFNYYLKDLSSGISNFFMGISDTGDDSLFVNKIREFLVNHIYKCVAFPFVKYLKKENALILKMVEAIQKGEKLKEKAFDGPYNLLNETEINHYYTSEEILNTKEIASLVNFEIIQKRGKMIDFVNEEGLSSDEYLTKLSYQGLRNLSLDDEAHNRRLNEELNVIKEMGFSDYFLIVADYVNYAKRNNIPVGPGRGSAAGSLVAYTLGITSCDPLKYDLLFERFLNKARKSMPDIDVDFSDIKRGQVIEYLRKKYGEEHVSYIAAIQTIGAKQSLRDVGRIFDYPLKDIDLLSKLVISADNDKDVTLRNSYKQNKDFKYLVDNDKYYLEIVSLASKIESFPRQRGMHAAGVVLNKENLEDVLPLDPNLNDISVEEYEKDYLEAQNFLKMDILAIRNLTIVEQVLERIKEKGISLDIDSIPYEDKDALEIINKGDTTGIFQLESKGMRNAIKIIGINSFDDLVALLALYRPGPMDEIKNYANRKNKKERAIYASPVEKEILSSTYGIIVYQEQIMQIANKIAGMSLSESDLFRRAISKKDSSKIDSLRNAFVKGCLKNGYSSKEATAIFDHIEKFANYGFNKSHAVSYAIFSSRMAYLKAHFKKEFYTAILDNTGGESDSFALAISEIKKDNIKILGPDVNASSNYFMVKDDSILWPINRIKGLYNDVAQTIILEREVKGPFRDYFDFVVRMRTHKMNNAQLMKLIDAGALDSLDKSRASLRINMPAAVAYSNMIADDEGNLIINMADFAKPVYKHVEDDYIDNLNREYEVLSLMISGSPLDVYKDVLAKYNITKLVDISKSGKTTYIAGIIKSIKVIKTKKGSPMAFVSLFDETSEAEITLFSDAYEIYSEYLKHNVGIIAEGYYKLDRGTFIVKTITPMEAK